MQSTFRYPASSAARILSPLIALVLGACAAAPPLKIYVLSESPTQNAVATISADPPSRDMPIIEVDRVTLPAYLDSRDLIVRQGDVLERSSTARWASRLSIEATELLTAQLEQRETGAWVTDQPPARAPDYRLMVHISRLDITSGGTGLVEADWELVPRSTSGEVIRRKTSFTMKDSVASDPKVANFERVLLERLADEIDLSNLR